MKRDHIQKANPDYQSDEYYRTFYGKDVIVIRLGHVNIVHCDQPGKGEIQKDPYDIVYYKQDIEGADY